MKMLLVGELNETLYSLNEYLAHDFQVQMCSENVQNVKDMVRLLRPSIIVMNISSLQDDVQHIFEMLANKLSTMPIVVIGTEQMYNRLKEQREYFAKMKILTRPLSASEVRSACNELLGLEKIIEPAKSEEETKEKKRILVVDDNALILRKMKQLLEKDYQIVLANSGKKALDILQKQTINLILLDYEMPGMNGREVFENVIGNEETKNIPVVFLTSIAEKNQIFEVLKNKPLGYILKPPADEKIRSIIEEAFAER